MKAKAPAADAGASGSSHSIGLMLLGGAVVVLLLGVLAFDRARDARSRAERAVINANALLSEARSHEQLAQRNRALLVVASTMQQRAQSSQVMPRFWSERRIDLRQQSLARDQLNTLLVSTARNSNQLLMLEEFDAAVTHPDDDLFTSLPDVRHPVMVSLRGALNFRIIDKPL